MTEDRRIQLVAEVDATQTRAGFNEIRREAGAMADSVTRSGQQAQLATNGIGGGATRSASQVEAAQRNLIGSIQRTSAALESGARAGSVYYEVLARQRGVDPSVLTPYLSQLRAMEAAQRQAGITAAATAEAQNRAAEAARVEATAQRAAAQALAGREAFLTSLREQISLYGRSSDEVLKFRAAQAGVASSAAPLIMQLQNVRAAHDAIAKAARDEADAQKKAVQVQTGQNSFIASLEQQALAIGKTRSQLLELQAAQLGVSAKAAPFIAQLRQSEGGLNHVGISAAQTAAALRGVPAQMSDIVTSLQGGQAPMTVLLQQGGQLKDMFGGAGNAAKALGGYVLGLVNPYTVAAVAIGGLAIAHHAGAAEAQAYKQALILSGNIAGGTSDQLADMARTIGQVSGSQRVAAEAITALAAGGRVSVENLQRFGSVAVEVQKVVGRSIADTAADFSSIGKTPLAGLEQINEKYHFITASTYAQVKALVDQGRASDAAKVAQNAYADAVTSQKEKILDSLTDWERGWIKIKNAASGAVDAAIDAALGRQATNVQKITGLLTERELIEKRIAVAASKGDAEKEAGFRADLENNKNSINALRGKDDAQKSAAKSASDKAKADEASIKWLKDGDQYLTRAAKLEKDITAARNEGAAANASSADIEKRISGIRRAYADIFNDGIDSNIEALKRKAAVQDVISARELSGIAAKRAAGSITEDDAINQTAAAELRVFDQKKTLLEKELGLASGKQNSLKEQASLNGELAVLEQNRISRTIQQTDELFALEQKRTRLAADNFANVIDQSVAERRNLVAQVTAQLDYNEQIGLTAEEVMKLTQARAESLAVRADENAGIADTLDLSGQLADNYRAQAAAIRDRSAAERAGFVKQRDPWINLQMSVKKYGDEASNVGAQIGDAMTNAFKSAEDAFVGFVTTGKISFSSLATSMLADMARIEAKKALLPLFTMAGNALAGMFDSTNRTDEMARIIGQLPGKATGGPVSAGTTYLVGEKGPEIFTPSGSGNIIPNHQLGGGGNGPIQITMVTNVTSSGATTETSGDSTNQGKMLADTLNQKMKAVIMQETRQGGILWNQNVQGAR